uniref:Uncharacterized protein n=1 Tax=Anguilla anguilla TaxID=7936 RepID=A0A0E9TYX1_ANGAN
MNFDHCECLEYVWCTPQCAGAGAAGCCTI